MDIMENNEELYSDALPEGGEESFDSNAIEDTALEDASEYTPKNKYEKTLYSIYKDKSLYELLKVVSHAIVVCTVYSFLVRLVTMIESEPFRVLSLIVITGAPFVIVSLLRLVINFPRPYDVLEFYETPPKKKSGRSFPSRHVFSVFVIAVALMPMNAFTGCLLLLLGVVLAVVRVLLGLHYIRDVVAGALIGIASGAIGLLVDFLISTLM